MYPATSDFSTSRNGDAWYYRHITTDDGRPSHDEVCQTSGAQFLVWVRSKVRWDMITKRTSDPYVIRGVRYATVELIDRDFRFGSAWTPMILEGYNEYLNRKGRPSVSNPLVRPVSRQYFDTSAVTEELLKKLITGGIGSGNLWSGNLGDGRGVTIPPGAIMPRLGASLGELPQNPAPTCAHRSNVDEAYEQPLRPGGIGAFGYVLIGAGAFLLATAIAGKE